MTLPLPRDLDVLLDLCVVAARARAESPGAGRVLHRVLAFLVAAQDELDLADHPPVRGAAERKVAALP